MAPQTPNAPAPRAPRKGNASGKEKGSKSNFIYIGTIIILVITIVAFVFMPSGNTGGSNGTTFDFGSYNGKHITSAQGGYLVKQVSIVNDALRQQGLSEQNYQLYAYQVWRQAFERTVYHYGVLDAVKQAGGAVTENFIDDQMADDPSFQENGKFSPKLYRETPNATKLSLRDDIRDNSLAALYTNEVNAMAPSSQEIAFLKDMAKETRTIAFAALPLSAYPESEVASWAAANAKLFSHLKLARVSVAKSQADAEKLLKQVKAGTVSFEDAAKKNSADAYAEKGGSMGAKYYYEIMADIEKKEDVDSLAALKAGEYSGVLKTLSGSWVFFKAEADATPADMADPVVLKDARAYMLRFERGLLEDWASAQGETLSATPSADFEKACKAAGLEVKESGPFPLNYGDIDFVAYGQRIPLMRKIDSAAAPELAEASGNEAFLAAVFSLAPGAVSKPIVLGDNIVVVKVKEAGAASEEDLASLSLYYPYFFQQKTSYEMNSIFLKSPLLKDNFMNVFFKYFMPKQ